jgi:hypothetical protein
MQRAESLIALGLTGLGIYFMWHATVLPIGWVEGAGPGGGAFPFWLSAVMTAAAGTVFLRALRADGARREPFFVPAMVRPVAMVAGVLTLTVAIMPWAGAYVALTGFMLWYLRVFGRHGWTLTLTLTSATLLFLFFFFEVTLKILLPKGLTEPLFLPLYAAFF